MIYDGISLLERFPFIDIAFVFAFLLILGLYVYSQLSINNSTVNLHRIIELGNITSVIDEAVENGRSIHLCLGQGAINTTNVVDSSVGLALLEYVDVRTNGLVASKATCGDALLFSSALGIVPGLEAHTPDEERRYGNAYYNGPDPLEYANGAVQQMGWLQPQANLFMGNSGFECLYIVGSTAGRQVQHTGGASSPLAAGLQYIATGNTLLGEEFYAASAYFQNSPDIKRLMIQDWLRYAILFTIIIGAVLLTIGYWR